MILWNWLLSLGGNVALGFLALFQGLFGVTGPTLSPQSPALTQATTTPPISSSTTQATSTASATPPKPKPTVVKPAPVSVPAVLAPTIPTPTPQPPPSRDPSEVNTEARAALVNILCTTLAGGYLHPISGSGIIVSGEGIVLTNAHVGQYFLLRDYPVPNNIECVVRTGSPAQTRYRAELLYLPSQWIEANANQIIAQQAMGTGEHDYAFLRITARTDGSALPETFPHLPLTLQEPQRDMRMLLASYPAGFLEGALIETSLYASSAIASVEQLFSFDGSGTVDLMSVGGTILSQAGSSGGGVVRILDGALNGIIVTATEAAQTSGRDLRAITLAHIDRSLTAHGQGSMKALLSGDLAQKAAEFRASVAQDERRTLIEALERR